MARISKAGTTRTFQGLPFVLILQAFWCPSSCTLHCVDLLGNFGISFFLVLSWHCLQYYLNNTTQAAWILWEKLMSCKSFYHTASFIILWRMKWYRYMYACKLFCLVKENLVAVNVELFIWYTYVDVSLVDRWVSLVDLTKCQIWDVWIVRVSNAEKEMAAIF